MNQYQQFIHRSRYARWLPEETRRETWEETVDRYLDFFKERIPDSIPWDELKEAITSTSVMPSMRAMMTAGKALERDNVAGYNCSYMPVDHPRAFDEMMYILTCGTGVGFSVERQYVSKLPEVAEEMHETDTTIVVSDSKIGWASAFRELISMLYAGKLPKWDMSRVRPAGTRLRTMGGRASGSEPLVELFNFTVALFRNATGRKLSSIECHDLCCKIAAVIVVGGVRRSALISLSNLTDDRLRRAKSGQWWLDNAQRGLANNSVCYTETPDFEAFLNEWKSLYESKSGERGLFSRVASQRQAAKNGRRDPNHEFGTNPCSEIILRPYQFCNLSEVVVRSDDTFEILKQKVKTATILGTMQSTLTDFRYLRAVWQRNTEEERLLGVSLTGIMDHPVLNASGLFQPNGWGNCTTLGEILEELKNVAVETNAEYAALLGIPASTAITCVKPSGTVSQLVDSASGIHPRFSEYYIRRVRADVKDPLAQFMQAEGFPCEPDVVNPSVMVFSFPCSAEGSTVVKDVKAMEQLKLWKIYQDYWCEHKPSITVYYQPEEFLEIGGWVYNNFDSVSGVSFLPVSEHTYQQAPYEEISKEDYDTMASTMPELSWEALGNYEKEDNTTGSQELACSAGVCEVVDLTEE